MSYGIVGERAQSAYPPNISLNHNLASTFTQARPANNDRRYLRLNPALESEQRIRAEMVALAKEPERAAAVSAEHERMDRARESEQRIRAEIDAREAERDRATIRRRTLPTLAPRADNSNQAGLHARVAGRDRAAAISAAREETRGNSQLPSTVTTGERARQITDAATQTLIASANTLTIGGRTLPILAPWPNNSNQANLGEPVAPNNAVDRARAVQLTRNGIHDPEYLQLSD